MFGGKSLFEPEKSGAVESSAVEQTPQLYVRELIEQI